MGGQIFAEKKGVDKSLREKPAGRHNSWVIHTYAQVINNLSKSICIALYLKSNEICTLFGK
jgi:hypothetical protein